MGEVIKFPQQYTENHESADLPTEQMAEVTPMFSAEQIAENLQRSIKDFLPSITDEEGLSKLEAMIDELKKTDGGTGKIPRFAVVQNLHKFPNLTDIWDDYPYIKACFVESVLSRKNTEHPAGKVILGMAVLVLSKQKGYHYGFERQPVDESSGDDPDPEPPLVS